MDLKQQLVEDLREATRGHDTARVSAIRMLRAAIQTMEIARTDPKDPKHGQPITDADLIVAVQKEVNQRRETLDFARKGGRDELAAQEERTIAIMEQYLPRALSREEIAAEIQPLIAQHGKDFRAVMPIASAQFRGRADGKLVAEVVRELTQA